MKIILIGNFEDKINSAVNCGYSNAVSGIRNVLGRMAKDKIIEEVICIDMTDVLHISSIEEQYDMSITFLHPNTFLNPVVLNWYNNVLKKYCKYNFLNIVWETEPLPKQWSSIFNSDLFFGYTAPTNFVLNQIKHKNVFYLPHFVDTSDYSRVDINEKLNEEKFTCLYVGQYTLRKGFDDATLSFIIALGEEEDTQLILKTFYMSNFEINIQSKLQSYSKLNLKSFKSKIFMIDEKLKDEEITDLYKKSSLFLSLARGEGFCLSGSSACVIGIPIIYTDWSGQKEVIEAPGNIPIPYTLDLAYGMEKYGYPSNDTLLNAIPNLNASVNAIRNKYSLWKKDRKKYYEEVQNNYKIIDDKYGYESIKNCFIKIFERVKI